MDDDLGSCSKKSTKVEKTSQLLDVNKIRNFLQSSTTPDVLIISGERMMPAHEDLYTTKSKVNYSILQFMTLAPMQNVVKYEGEQLAVVSTPANFHWGFRMVPRSHIHV